MVKILIYGYTKLSSELAKILVQKKYSFIVAEEEEESVESAISDGFSAYQTDLSIDENLIEAGVGKELDVLFCMSEDVHKNLFVTLSARALDKDLKIISFSSSKQDEIKMRLSGANGVINPYEIGTQRLFRLMQKPTLFWVMDMLLFGSSDIIFAEIKIDKKSKFSGIALKNLEDEIAGNILVVGMERGEKFIFDTIKTGYHTKEGDVVIVIGEKKDIKGLL